MEKYGKLSLNYLSYPFLSEALSNTPKRCSGMADNVGPDWVQSDLHLHSLLRPSCPNTWNFYGKIHVNFQILFICIEDANCDFMLFWCECRCTF